MGRDAGHIALNAGIAGGADVVLIPEIPYDMPKICAKIDERRRAGRNFSLVVVAESVKALGGNVQMYTDAHGQSRYGGIGALIAQEIAARTGAETRVTVLGHVQRGGAPTPLDRVLASAFGVYAVRCGVEDGGTTRWFGGAANIGRRPTVDGQNELLEAHLFDFSGDLYDRTLRVAFVERLRPEKKFDGLDALKAQIAEDCRAARSILAERPREASPEAAVRSA